MVMRSRGETARLGRSILGSAAAVGLAGLSLGPGSAQALEVIAYPGLEVPESGQSLEISRVRPSSSFGFRSAPVINASGEVAFWANLRQTSGSSFGDSIWTYTGGTLAPVALTGDAVPGMAGATLDDNISRRVLIDSAGNVAYGPQVNTTSGTVKGIFVGGATPDRVAVIEGQTVPQVDPLSPAFGYVFESIGFGTNFLNPYTGEEFVFNANNVGFQGSIGDPNNAGPDFTNALYIERPTGGAGPTGLELIARNGFDTSFIPSSEVLAIKPNGEALFRTNISPGGGDPSFNAIVTYTADISFEAQTGSGAGGDISFTSLAQPNINAAGNTVFAARFSDLTASDSGLFKTNDPDGIIATEGIVAAGAPDLSGDGVPDFTFNDFISVRGIINANGHVLFRQSARTPDGSLSVTGLWSDRTGGLTSLDPIAFHGDQAPGLPEGTVFTQLALNGVETGAVINANDDVAFLAQAQAPGGPIINGLWAEKDGVLELVAATGQTIDLPDGGSLVITTLDFAGGSGNQDGRPSGFSDNGQITFRADGSGSANGVYVLTTVGFLEGDYNNDGFVSQGDLDLVLLNWGDTVLPGGFDISNLGDGSFDGLIGQNELDGVLLNWGDGVPPSVTAIPEPASAGLLGLTVWAVAGRRVRGRTG